ncbi:U3 small nucleolar RNA-associated protein 15 [Ceratocystis fimbriata CBS 114723]|uniref:U3 small nucleolar RNA-associated protein 15 n=1 Tax=Ceratocystis fimbriata CBS 114723 TaxID=1035309 RepID=A0A2C5WWJ5_9PEZI|nr:U3 small nucleolar RNA-associated protein 15 [Ceratocystis fimbriata CBS 114723]
MATSVVPLQQVKLTQGPSPFTAEQRYWKSFKNQLLFSLPSNKAVTHISSPANASALLASATNDLFAVTSGTRIQLYSIRTRKLVKSISRFGDIARSGEIRRDGRILVAGEDTGRIQVFDVGSRSILRTWNHHKQPVWTTKFSPSELTTLMTLPSGTTLLAAASNTISVLDLVAGRPLHLISNHQKTVTSLSLASGGRRVLSGALDGHVKVFETTGWNVVNTTKYPAPILSLEVVGAGHGADAVDRHLAVGMASGALSIRTRLTGAEAAKAKEREKEMEALLAGNIAAHDAKNNKKKRTLSLRKRLDLVGESADVVIAEERTTTKKERQWQRDLRHGLYATALDAVLDRRSLEYKPVTVLTVLVTLRHRNALQAALEGRDEHTVQPVLQWVCKHIMDPRYVNICAEVGILLLDLYAQYVDESAELWEGFRALRRKVRYEVERAQQASQTNGMAESLMMGAA